MIKALSTGVAGLRTHQTRMDVTGNNIANANTTAFKRSRASFAEMLGGQPFAGGTIGKGSQVGSIDQNWSQGSFDFTGFANDLALSGDGFFVVDGGQGPLLTRAGNFQFDAKGFLVAPGGQRVQGWTVQPDGGSNMGALQDVRLDVAAKSPPVETATVRMGGNLSANAVVGQPSGTASVSSVVYDAQGVAHTLVVTMEKTGLDEWTVQTAELAGDPQAVPPLPATPLGGAGSLIQFDASGRLVAPTPAQATFTGMYPNSADDVAITFDFGSLTQFGGSTTAAVSGQDGQAAGEIVGYGFNQQGVLLLNFSNGKQLPIAQLAIGQVNSPNGLDQRGEGFYSSTQRSGDLRLGRAGQEANTAVMAGALEASNVDLATEFTDMIVTQRGYQASARVITTADELLQELVMLKR